VGKIYSDYTNHPRYDKCSGFESNYIGSIGGSHSRSRFVFYNATSDKRCAHSIYASSISNRFSISNLGYTCFRPPSFNFTDQAANSHTTAKLAFSIQKTSPNFANDKTPDRS
jgi:hypothetical protein